MIDPPDPVETFRGLFARAEREEASDATAMALATADEHGRPSVRMVLLKGVDEGGFVFYTNYASRKAREIDANPRGALCIHWPNMGVQVRVEGNVARTSDEESDAYFLTRPREAQLGAWASRQSGPLASNAELLARIARTVARFPLGPVPRPPFWGGYRLLPERIEFWRSRPHRLHERELYERRGTEWVTRRLFP